MQNMKLLNALKALGVEYSNDEFRSIFHDVDDDENGVIDIDEFLRLVESIDDVSDLESSQE
ncbi:MAG: EF-hand domain-containing protein [Candidatus Poseidonia sp.]|uniref:EF-hand domain-containing protein n=1 Tax=Poseidonia sp. TaxID=2666344 RepID=UPI0030C41B1A|nr:EF-hand domain-containing protein [Poseidonia sp.]